MRTRQKHRGVRVNYFVTIQCPGHRILPRFDKKRRKKRRRGRIKKHINGLLPYQTTEYNLIACMKAGVVHSREWVITPSNSNP